MLMRKVILERVSGMKKWMRFICVVLCVLLVGGCAAPSPGGESHPGNSADNEEGNFLVKLDETDRIVIKLPSIKGENATADKQIEDYVCGVLRVMTGISFDLQQTKSAPSYSSDWYADGYTDYALWLDSRVAQCNETLVSIVFEGMLNYRSAAHPTHLFFTLNYNPQTNKTVAFTDMYYLNDSLYGLFLQKIKEKMSASGISQGIDESFFSEYCSQEDFVREMSREDIYQYYFTDTSIGIGFPVPHALGDYIELEIPLDDV